MTSMTSDSETESEPESPQFQGYPSNWNAPIIDSDQAQDTEYACDGSPQNAKAAIDALRDIATTHDIRQRQDHGLHDKILRASNTIVTFLKDAFSQASPDDSQDTDASLDAFCELVTIPFMSLLFYYRKIFHSIAAEALLPGTATSTVVCWVDVILATLSKTIVTVAHGRGTSLDNSMNNAFEIVRQQSEDNDLRAAAQLPLTWLAVPGVISSERASPAAKRLALRLTFAVYLMQPQLTGCDVWPEDGISPSEMLQILQSLHTQTAYDTLIETPLNPDDLQRQERINDAMMISLTAASDVIHQQSQPLSPFRPHSINSLLHVIQAIIRPESGRSSLHLASPHEALDTAQTILLGWGRVLSWCWTNWEDQRIANAECIVHLTSTWLFHLDNLKAFSPNPLSDWTDLLTLEIAESRAKGSSAITRLLHHGVTALCSIQVHDNFPRRLVNVLLKCCWASVRLLDPRWMGGWREDNHTVELCMCLCGLFVILANSDEELHAKHYIIEAFTLVTSDQLQLALKAVQGDTKVRFALRLDEAITRSRRSAFLLKQLSGDVTSKNGSVVSVRLMLSDTGGFTSKGEGLLLARCMLNFLTILWRGGCCEQFPRQAVSTFLCSLVDCLSQARPGSSPSAVLCDSMLTTLAVLESTRSDLSPGIISKLWEDDTIWQIAMAHECSDLPIASAFSQCIIGSTQVCDPLCCAEAWDYLRDTLLLVISRSFVADDEPLSLLVCPSICRALLRLLQLMDSDAMQFVLASPWTMALCTDLQAALDNKGSDEYGGILKDRLEIPGKALIHYIKRKSHLDTDEHTPPFPQWDLDLIFCHLHPHPKLILVPSGVDGVQEHDTIQHRNM